METTYRPMQVEDGGIAPRRVSVDTVRIPRSQFAQMKRQFLAIQNIHLTTYEKSIQIKRLEQRCKLAEKSAITSEIRLAEIIKQVSFDSPKLATSLLLAIPVVKPTKKLYPDLKTSSESTTKAQSINSTSKPTISEVPSYTGNPKPSSRLAEIVETDSPSDSSCVTVIPTHPSARQEKFDHLGKKSTIQKNITVGQTDTQIPVNMMPGVSKFIFDNLVQELCKTKKQLNAILLEKDRIQTQVPIPLLDVQEYEDIIYQLQQDVLILRHQYHQLRDVLHDQQGEDTDNLVSTITSLQDKVRKQDKQIQHQQTLFNGLQSKYNSLKDSLPPHGNDDDTSKFQSTNISEITNEDDTTKGSKAQHEEMTYTLSKEKRSNSMQKTLEEMDSLQQEVKELRNTNSILTSKCKILVDQHERTLSLLRTMDEEGLPDIRRLYKGAAEELFVVRSELKSAGKTIEKLTLENEWCKDMVADTKEAITLQEVKHREERADFYQEKASYERNFQLISQYYQNTMKQMRNLQAENQLFRAIKEKLKNQTTTVGPATSCAKEIIQPWQTWRDTRMHVDSDIQTDGPECSDVPEYTEITEFSEVPFSSDDPESSDTPSCSSVAECSDSRVSRTESEQEVCGSKEASSDKDKNWEEEQTNQ